MSIITSFKIEKEYSNLEDNIKKLKFLNNIKIFLKTISESVKLLSSISIIVGNEK